MDDGGLGPEVVRTDGVFSRPEEEAEGKMGIVLDAESNLRKFGRGEAGGGAERLAEEVPASFGAVGGDDGDDIRD